MVARGPEITASAGFPFRASAVAVPGYKLQPGETILGEDFECSGSIRPGMCAFSSPLTAADLCAPMANCKAVAVLPNGTDACSEPLAVLKHSGDSVRNSAVGPTVR